MKNLACNSLWKIIQQILTILLMHFSLKGWKNVFFEPGSGRLKCAPPQPSSLVLPTPHAAVLAPVSCGSRITTGTTFVEPISNEDYLARSLTTCQAAKFDRPNSENWPAWGRGRKQQCHPKDFCYATATDSKYSRFTDDSLSLLRFPRIWFVDKHPD